MLLDERQDSINDAFFVTEMTGYPNQPTQTTLVDYPASYHNLAGGFSFADGHSEIRRWQDARTTPLKDPGTRTTPNNPDVVWLQERCTRLKK